MSILRDLWPELLVLLALIVMAGGLLLMHTLTR
jgi:hypothetical protein